MFPVAWAVVDVENHSNWMWFLHLVKKDLNITEDGLGWSFQSDQHPSIIHAFRMVVPQAETRRCARHIFSKWRRGRDGDLYASLYWSIVKSTNIPALEENFSRLYEYDPAAVDAILEVQPKLWCKTFFQCHSKSDVVDNNMCETFNSKIKEARHMSIVSMFEKIRMSIVQRFVERRNYANFKFVRDFGPRIWAMIEDNKDKSVYCHIFTNGDGGWEVFEGQMKFIVKFEERKCSCRGWDLTGIPCHHAVAVISHRREKVEDFVSHWYTKDVYKKSYAYSIQPVNDERFRRKTSLPDIIPPPKKLVRGRRKVHRIPETWESKSRKKSIRHKQVQRCTSCFRTGHKSSSCSQSQDVTGESSGSVRGPSYHYQDVYDPLCSIQMSTSNSAGFTRRFAGSSPSTVRPFSGIESFINPITGLTMPMLEPSRPNVSITDQLRLEGE